MTLNLPVYAWNVSPTWSQVVQFEQHNPHEKHVVWCVLPDSVPHYESTSPQNEYESSLHLAIQNALSCATTQAVHCVPNAWNNTHLWLIPHTHASSLHTHFSVPIQWQTEAIAPAPEVSPKAWQTPPAADCRDPSSLHILIIGAGIAGAATAYECAIRGAKVTVLEAQSQVAQAGSGNRQGLLYAKISPHATEQTELLLSGYGYTRHLLRRLLPEQTTWQACGVLHLNHNAKEAERNRKLAQQTQHAHLYRAVSAQQASELAGICIEQDGLFWQQGAWLNPASLVQKLLSHPNITLHTNQRLIQADYDGAMWHVRSNTHTWQGSHLVFCTGASSLHTPIVQTLPLQIIRGQTSLVAANKSSLQLKIALSGASYISPAWQGEHCFGATFAPNCADDTWQSADEQHNRNELAQLNNTLYQSFSTLWNEPSSLHESSRGHAALRCDCHDHLPAVGALGDADAMRRVYAQYALDKNYRINTPCPYLPNAYINTAHGSRGLATAPLCAADIAAQIMNTPRLLSPRLRHALNPNRLIIKELVHGKVGAKSQ